MAYRCWLSEAIWNFTVIKKWNIAIRGCIKYVEFTCNSSRGLGRIWIVMILFPGLWMSTFGSDWLVHIISQRYLPRYHYYIDEISYSRISKL